MAYLKQKLSEPAFWNLIDVEGVAETCSVLVCGLPFDEKLANIGIFFKNKNKVGMTLDVKKCELRPNTGEAILLLGTIYGKKMGDIKTTTKTSIDCKNLYLAVTLF